MNVAAGGFRVLQVHTRYRLAGGEDVVVDAEKGLLREAGVNVHQVLFDNADLHEGVTVGGDIRLAASAIWSRAAERRVRTALTTTRAQVMHVHNTFTAASPSVYAAAASVGVPVVQTLHNYRLVCPAATAFRDGHTCTDCVGKDVPWPGVVHACVRSSHRQSLVAAATSAFHRMRGTYKRHIAQYIALSEFQRELMIRGGLPAKRIVVVPNFLGTDPGPGDLTRKGVVYVGRLSIEKGMRTLVAASALMPGLLTVAGDGPLQHQVEGAHRRGSLSYVGGRSRAEVAKDIKSAVAVVVPSVCFEGFPLVILEAFATATPVIASRIGSLAELIQDGVTGLLVEPGNAVELAERSRWAVEHPEEMRAMGINARQAYEARYRGTTHLASLLEIYESVLDSAGGAEKRSV